MPSLKVHCDISLERSGGEDDYKELHQWIDEPRKWLKHNHRIERHSYNGDNEKKLIKQLKDFLK